MLDPTDLELKPFDCRRNRASLAANGNAPELQTDASTVKLKKIRKLHLG
jgi:hypothetical protein